MIQQRAQNGQILRYFIARNVQIGGNYKNFHHTLVVLWGNYKVLGQNIHPCLKVWQLVIDLFSIHILTTPDIEKGLIDENLSLKYTLFIVSVYH